MNKLHLEVLSENLSILNKSVAWLLRSFEETKQIQLDANLSMEQFDRLEVLTSRYARTADMLINKVFKSIDIVESEIIGTIIDIMNRAEKREIVQSAGILHTLKDLRNNIAHEYNLTENNNFFADVIKYTPVLIDTIKNTNVYCEKYMEKLKNI